ncbi:VOC family protein [Paenibacillus sp. FJAT-26967]|uniref:VOC family protein n=1 Tax=Paenibacillus sp. FJAT-26967 TaxID=1729690 RepID=UPI000838859B|nr:VOC family protein [Paenibacillus sp. FJAT-26967]
MTFTKLVDVFVPVSDLDRSVPWYIKVLGLRLLGRDNEHARLSFYEGTCLTLTRQKELNTYSAVAFNVNVYDAHVDYVRMKDAGVTMVEKLKPLQSMSRFTIADPDGNPIEIVGWEESGHEKTGTIRLGGAYLPVKDLDKSTDWYESNLNALIGQRFTISPSGGTDEVRAVAFTNINLCLIETPQNAPLEHRAFTIGSTDPRGDYELLRYRSAVKLSTLTKEFNRDVFGLLDPDDNQIGIIGILH